MSHGQTSGGFQNQVSKAGGLNQFGSLERTQASTPLQLLLAFGAVTVLWISLTVAMFVWFTSRAPGVIWVVVSMACVAWFIHSVIAEDSRAVKGQNTPSQRDTDSLSGWKLARGTAEAATVAGSGNFVRRVRRKTSEFLNLAAMRSRSKHTDASQRQ